MMYEYQCKNIECTERNKLVTINKPMAQASDTENCSVCGQPLQRMYGLQGHGTFSDGYKSGGVKG